MHWKKTRVARWGKPNLVHNVKEKMSKAVLKEGMTKLAKNQAFEHVLAQNLNQMWWQFQNNFKMTLKNECSKTQMKTW